MATYKNNGEGMALIERPLYGSSRVGMDVRPVFTRNVTQSDTGVFTRYLTQKQYELSDHLGNVRTVVKDVKYATNNVFAPDVVSYQNYYPFGMLQEERIGSTTSYRYGYNGKEKDDEVKGAGNSLDFGARIYDTRIARWLSPDPKEFEQSSWSPYRAMFDNPLFYIDGEGERERRALLYAVEHFNDAVSKAAPRKQLARGSVPNHLVCNQLVYLSYLNIAGNPYGKAKWNNSLRRDMFNWFGKGYSDKINRELITGSEERGITVDGKAYKVDFMREDFNNIEEGDVLFMGNYDGDNANVPWGNNEGHVVLAVEVVQSMSSENSVTIRVFGAYAQTNNDRNDDARKAGYELMTFTRTDVEGQDGKIHSAWVSSHDENYILYGIGRVIQSRTKPADANVNTSAIKEAAKVAKESK